MKKTFRIQARLSGDNLPVFIDGEAPGVIATQDLVYDLAEDEYGSMRFAKTLADRQAALSAELLTVDVNEIEPSAEDPVAPHPTPDAPPPCEGGTVRVTVLVDGHAVLARGARHLGEAHNGQAGYRAGDDSILFHDPSEGLAALAVKLLKTD